MSIATKFPRNPCRNRPGKPAELTAEQLADLRTRFDDALPMMAKYVPALRSRYRQDADADDAVGRFWFRVWQSWLKIASRGERPEDCLASLTFLAETSALSNRCVTGSFPATEPLDERAPLKGGPHKHSLAQLGVHQVAERNRPAPCQRWIDQSEDMLADRKGTDPAIRAMVRDAIDFITSRLDATGQLVVFHLAAGMTGREAARAVGRSPCRVTQIRQAVLAHYEALDKE